MEADLPPEGVPNRILVRPDGSGLALYAVPCTRVPSGLEATLPILGEGRAVTLLIDGGPIFLRRITLAVQPPGARSGPIDAGEAAAADRFDPSRPR
jgi:hypothetical protein